MARPWTSRATRSRSSSRPRTRPGSQRRPTSLGPASRSSAPEPTCRSRSTRTGRHEPGDRRSLRRRTSSRRRTTSRQSSPRSRLGDGDAAIVYVTDAKASNKVSTVEIPSSANVPATYAGVVVKASKHAEAAQAFLTWLAGPDGQAVLGPFGFLPPSVIGRRASRPRTRSPSTLPLILFLTDPGRRRWSGARCSGAACWRRWTSPVVLDGAPPEPRHDRGQPRR